MWHVSLTDENRVKKANECKHEIELSLMNLLHSRKPKVECPAVSHNTLSKRVPYTRSKYTQSSCWSSNMQN